MSDTFSNSSEIKKVNTELRLDARPVSRGIAIGRVVCLYGSGRQYYRTHLPKDSVSGEIARFRSAHKRARNQLKLMSGSPENTKTTSSIFDVHLSILEDSSMKRQIEDVISIQNVNAEWAVKLITDEYIARYRAITDEHFRDRYIDVEDVADQLQTALGGKKHPIRLARDSIIVARELRPSTLAELSKERPLAIVTESGGWTSHTFIVARELELPAVTGVKKLMRRVRSGESAIVDGFAGRFILNPSPETIESYEAEAKTIAGKPGEQFGLPIGPSKTLDGREITIRANFDIPSSFKRAKKLGAQGIGLFRSEYLFNRFKGFPSEAEQTRAYREIADYAGDGRARIRTFDLGTDQLVDHYLRREKNPALGLRGIRMGFILQRHLSTQLRSLLQASHDRNIDIIIPMVSGVSEILRVRKLISKEIDSLARKNIPFGAPRLGAMIEIPSAVFDIDHILEEVECLCLGTNDLVQYLMAADRDNEGVAEWFRSLHPAMIKSLDTVIRAAAKAEKPVVVCGEMAGSPFYVPILIGLGATELSMNFNSILKIRRIIAGVAYEETRELVNQVLESRTPDDSESIVKAFIGERWSHLFPAGLQMYSRSI